MDKLEIILSLRNSISELQQEYDSLLHSLELLTDFYITENRFIPDDIYSEVVEKINAAKAAQNICLTQWNLLDNSSLPEYIGRLNDDLNVLETQETNKQKYARALEFFKLYSEDDTVMSELSSCAQKLQTIIDSAEDYASVSDQLWHYEAFAASAASKTDESDRLELTYKFASVFSFPLIKSLFEGSIHLLDEVDVQGAKAGEKLQDSEGLTADNDAESQAAPLADYEPSGEEMQVNEPSSAAAPAPASETPCDINNDLAEDIAASESSPSLKDALRLNGAFVSLDEFSPHVVLSRSAKADNPITATVFKQEIWKKLNPESTMLLSNTLRDPTRLYRDAKNEIVAKSFKEFSTAEALYEQLFAFGYIDKYDVFGMGTAYLPSPRAEKVLSQQTAREFIKVPKSKCALISNLSKSAEQTACLQIAQLQLFSMYSDQCPALSQLNIFSMNPWDHPVTTNVIEYNDNGKKDYWLHILSFGGDDDEYDRIVETLCDMEKKSIFQYHHTIFAGLNLKSASALAESYVPAISDAVSIGQVYLYSLSENAYYAFPQIEQISPDCIPITFHNEAVEESAVETDASSEDEPAEEIAENYGSSAEIPNDADEINLDDTAAEGYAETASAVYGTAENAANDEHASSDEAADDGSSTITENLNASTSPAFEHFAVSEELLECEAYNMINQGKLYCASALLNCCSADSYPRLSSLAAKLAYAVNDPAANCLYTSQSLYDKGIVDVPTEPIDEYLTVAAAIRVCFSNHAGYDYALQQLRDSIRSYQLMNGCSDLNDLIHELTGFKNKHHIGVDALADYRMRNEEILREQVRIVQRSAGELYTQYVENRQKESKKQARFLETKNILFSPKGDLAVCLGAAKENDLGWAEAASEFLRSHFICNGAEFDAANLDEQKIIDYINDAWNKAQNSPRVISVRKNSDLMGELRNNLLSAMKKIGGVLCQWVKYASQLQNKPEDAGHAAYSTIRGKLITKLDAILEMLDARINENVSSGERAGIHVMHYTVEELLARLEGGYREEHNMYYYVEFLRGSLVPLDKYYLPAVLPDSSDVEPMSPCWRIQAHASAELPSFEDRIHEIFEKTDDYGAALLIDQYYADVQSHPLLEEFGYSVSASLPAAEERAAALLNEFISDLELAQSYGKIANTGEDKKDCILKMINDWHRDSLDTGNFSLFYRAVNILTNKINEDAKVRGEQMLQEWEDARKEASDPSVLKRLDLIRTMIDRQNYTVAEDMLSRLNSGECESYHEILGDDHLSRFLNTYSECYRMVQGSSKSFERLVNNAHNKHERGAARLVDNWMKNGCKPSCKSLTTLLEALGFPQALVTDSGKVDRCDTFTVVFHNEEKGARTHQHPIAAFGSEAWENGFKVACLYGGYKPDSIIHAIGKLGDTAHVLMLCDSTFTLAERRKLARLMKEGLHNDHVFGVIDRVMMMYLVKNYDVDLINRILMAVMIPFSYYQPYVWKSGDTIPPEMFRGRAEALSKIESPTGVNIVYGGRQLGKSAMLKKAVQDVDGRSGQNGTDRAVYIDIKDLDAAQTARKVAYTLYDEGILTEEVETTDWETLARLIKRRLADDKLPKISYLLLLLDEGDAFISSCNALNYRPLDHLGDIRTNNNFKFVIAGLRNVVQFNRESALAANSAIPKLDSLTVRPFTVSEARELLELPLFYLGFRFAEKDRESLITLILAESNYFPGLIQLYCAKLIEALKKSYAGYNEAETPVYTVQNDHIKKVLADKSFMSEVKTKFEITLRLDADNYYYIIALMMAHLYHHSSSSAGYTVDDVRTTSQELDMFKITNISTEKLEALMQELCDLNILRENRDGQYLFARYNFLHMMGTSEEIDKKIQDLWEDEIR